MTRMINPKRRAYVGAPLLVTVAVLFWLLWVVGGTALAAVQGIVIDEADALTSSEERALDREFTALSTELNAQFGVVFIRDVHGRDPADVANEWYDSHRMGAGENRDGVMLLVATESRDMYLMMNGEPYRILTRSLVEDTSAEAGRHFARGEWAAGASLYAKRIAQGLRDYQAGFRIAGRTASDMLWSTVGGSAAGTLLLLGGESVARRKLVNLGVATRAFDYMVPHSTMVTRHEDVQVGVDVSRVLIPDTSGSTGSSGSWSSSGSSRGGFSSKF